MFPRYASLSSEDLVKACAGLHNPAAWREFIRRFHPVIAKVVLRTAGQWGNPSPHLLDDLVQDTYLKLCDNDAQLLRSFEPRHEDAIYGFLKTVAANVVRDHFKSAGAEKRGAEKTDPLPDEHRLSDSHRLGTDPNHHVHPLHRVVLLRQLDEILYKLTNGEEQTRNRLIFWFHYRHGLSASAIASIPGINLSTKGVETILRRLTLMMRAQVSETGAIASTGNKSDEGFGRPKSL